MRFARISIVVIVIFLSPNFVSALNIEFIKDIFKILDTYHHIVFFGCFVRDSLKVAELASSFQKYYNLVNLQENTSKQLREILDYKFYPPSIILVDYSCKNAVFILQKASEFKSFNKTYQWLIIEKNSNRAITDLNKSMAVGLNSQILYINKTDVEAYELYDIYSQGRHIGSPMNITLFGKWSLKQRLKTITTLQEMRAIIHRGQFNMLNLRGVLVIDKDNISTNKQIHELLAAEDYKSVGIFSMIKYSAELVRVISDCLNFTIDYRVTRGWAGRLGNTTYRLGLMGVVQRGEVDIAASPSFLRISRLNDLDFYHQSWNFDAGFVYLYSNLVKHNAGGGDFLAPFNIKVWILSLLSLLIIAATWKYFEFVSKKMDTFRKEKENDISGSILLQSVATICQQGLDPAPKKTTTRVVAFSLILFSLLMYNYYTSSVVGGLLSNNDPGIKNLHELVNSHLTLVYEDIGYNKVVMTEQTNNSITMKVRKKFYSQQYFSNDLEGYATLSKAIPHIRAGTHAFHCEFSQIFGEIAKQLDANEICNLRTVTGLLSHETLAMVLTKKSQYLEIFKIILNRAREIGVIKRELKRTRESRPKCQGALTVLPVALPSVLNAFLILGGGIMSSLIIFGFEICWTKYKLCTQGK